MKVLLAAAGLLAAAAALLLAFSPSGGGSADPSSPPEDLRRAAEVCVEMQLVSASGDIDPGAFRCMYDLMDVAFRSGRSAELVSASAPYARPEMWATCHAVGHSLGPDMLASGMYPEDAMVAALGTEPQELADVFCAAAVVHGVIDGASAGARLEDLPRIASYCEVAHRVHPYYGSECAHYFGHTVWDTVASVGVEAAEACALLDAHGIRGGVESCMGGVVMEVFGLQDAAYGSELISSVSPEISEFIGLCDGLEQHGFRAFDGCWGGLGWLLSGHLSMRMNDLDPAASFSVFPADLLGDAVAVHAELLGLCGTSNCVATLLQHMRPQEWTNGVGQAVCDARPDTVMSPEDLDAMCMSVLYGMGR